MQDQPLSPPTVRVAPDPPTGSAGLAAFAGIGAGLVALTALGLVILWWSALPLDGDARARVFVATECLAGLLWLRAVALVRRAAVPAQALWIVLGAAVAMRALAFVAPPLLSSDVYRYVWDGRVQHAGINPYRYLPDAPQLAFLRDSVIYPLVNRADYAHTIYPPASQVVFALASVVAPGLYGMKAVMTAFDALAIVALLRLLRLARRHAAQVLIYAWLPLPVWEFVNNGHIDAVAAGLLALALWLAAYGRPVRTGLVLAAAALTKFLPGVVLPAFWHWQGWRWRDWRWRDRPWRDRPWRHWHWRDWHWREWRWQGRHWQGWRRQDWRLPAAFVAGLIAFYAPYVGVGWRVLGFLPGYVKEEHIGHGGGIFLLQVLDLLVPLPPWITALYAAATLAILAALGLRFAATALPPDPGERTVTQARQAAILGAVLLVALSPHYPWYLGWLAPLACLASLASVEWLLAAAPLLALGPIQHLLIPVALYVPAAALAMRDCRRGPPSPGPSSPAASSPAQPSPAASGRAPSGRAPSRSLR